jgi:cell division protein ZapA (FtsZ GTPase activity inhibitor)
MARKTLLTEGELRRFMKLADMSVVGTPRLQEMGYGSEAPGARDELPEEEDEMGIEMGAEEAPADELPMGDEEAVDDELAMDEPAEEAGLEGEMELSDDEAQAIIDLADRLQAAMGGSEAELGAEDELALDDEELPAEDDLEAPEGGEELDMSAEEDEEDLVAEVARRVAQRLRAQDKKEAIVDSLAERIMKRLTK